MTLGKKLATSLILASLVLSVSGTNGQAPTPTTKQAKVATITATPQLVSRSGEVLMLQREEQQQQAQKPKAQQPPKKIQETKVVEAPKPTPKAQPAPQTQPVVTHYHAHPESDQGTAQPRDSYGEWQNFVATFYTLNEGSGTGKTATGTIPTAHRTLAVDPRVIPLGSVVEIKYPDGSTERRIAEDTGGAIHGNILDVYVVTVQEALDRGRQHVQLRIVHK